MRPLVTSAFDYWRTPFGVTVAGWKVHVVPWDNPAQLKLIGWLNPFSGISVAVRFDGCPGVRVYAGCAHHHRILRSSDRGGQDRRRRMEVVCIALKRQKWSECPNSREAKFTVAPPLAFNYAVPRLFATPREVTYPWAHCCQSAAQPWP